LKEDEYEDDFEDEKKVKKLSLHNEKLKAWKARPKENSIRLNQQVQPPKKILVSWEKRNMSSKQKDYSYFDK